MKVLTLPLLLFSALLVLGGSAPVYPTTGAEPAGTGPTVAAAEPVVVRQRPQPVADPSVTLVAPPKPVLAGGFMVIATYPAGAELSWTFSPDPVPGQHYYQRVSDTQQAIVFLYPPAGNQTVTASALLVQPGRDVDAAATVTVAGSGSGPTPPNPDDGGKKPDDGKKPSPALDGVARVAHDAVKVYARLMADAHGEAKAAGLKDKAAFDAFMRPRTEKARLAAFGPLMQSAEATLPKGPWREGDAATAEAWIGDTETGLRKAGE